MAPPVVDETAGDLPVRDFGTSRRGLIPIVQDTQHDSKPWKKQHVLKTKDAQRLCRFPREYLEELCLRLQEENRVLRQHSHTQEQNLRRMSTRLMRLHQAQPMSSGVKERDMGDTIQELEAHVAMLESQIGVLQNKLSLAKQHILDLVGRTPYKFSKVKNREVNDGVRIAPQTAPPYYYEMMEETKMEMERLSSMAEQVRATKQELTAQALKETFEEKEKEIAETVKDKRKQHTEKHRITIKGSIDLIHLQKQVSDKSTALRATQEKLNNLKEAYENQLQESQRSLRKSHVALLEKVEELAEQLKQEKERTLALESESTTSTLSLMTINKLQEKITDLEGERNLIKENYDTLLESTTAAQRHHYDQMEKCKEVDQIRGSEEEKVNRSNFQRIVENLQAEREEKERLRLEKENLKCEKEILEEQRERDRGSLVLMEDKQQQLEQDVLHYKEQISVLQHRQDFVTKKFDMSVEELSEILQQIKAYRIHQESRAQLEFLSADGKVNALYEMTNIQGSHAETVVELQKTRHLLLLEHNISKNLQEELNTVNQKMEKEREENRKRVAEKEHLVSKSLLQIDSLQAQVRKLAHSHKRSIPVQCTGRATNLDVEQPVEETSSQLRAGESLLEIHLKAATFTPSGLRVMVRNHPGVVDGGEDIITFCTYSLLDFETHSTPLVPGSKPSYSFTSHYALTAQDLSRLESQGSRVQVELHQALGGVRFLTHGSGQMSFTDAIERRGEQINICANITGYKGEIVGVVDFWVRLFCSAEPIEPMRETGTERTAIQNPTQICLGWQSAAYGKIYDYGGGIPNELEVTLERCVGLNTRWSGLLPNAYLTYRLYDLPPHVSQTIKCTVDPVFNDTARYPLAVTTDVLHYLRSSSLWIYLFDDSENQIPPAYLAKTPIPLQVLASGQQIRGDYVLRDPSGTPQGMVRVMIKWKYPLHTSFDNLTVKQGRKDRVMESTDSRERKKKKAKMSQMQKARPGVKVECPNACQMRSSDQIKIRIYLYRSKYRKKSIKTIPDIEQGKTYLKSDPGLVYFARWRSSEGTSPKMTRKNYTSTSRAKDHATMEKGEQKEQSKSISSEESDTSESSETSSTQSDIIVIPARQKKKKGNNLRVEILSLTFEPSSHVVLDKMVQRVYVEYRLLGIPMETTETPMSLMIYVDGSQAAPLRQYLYTMLEGTDPNQGRLKFTVVSEPMDSDQECVDVGYAYLDLQELLLTGNDAINYQLDIVRVDEETEVIGNLKVSLEAAKTLTRIHQEFCKNNQIKNKVKINGEEREEEKRQEKNRKKDKNKHQIQLIDYDSDNDLEG
ncbi:protein fantom [Xyrichtys novacula]|uniref:Protein fantom n=1 Tax=Xyrichtys novacula TaxID=13765 RepID=A0AAV1HL19_XYRNO|nr:protein fantom [Xyrichtys novacula]